jgi:thiol-disulfide isomerase/thioredoxin
MKLLTLKFILIFIYLISSSSSYAIQQPNLKNLVIHKDPKKLEKINFINVNNETINISKFENSLIIINFWATWCAPCIEEMPSLNRLQTNTVFNNLQIIPINVGRDTVEKSKNFYKKLKIDNLEIYFDKDVELANKFLLRGLPTTVFINKKGEEFARVIGFINFDNKTIIKWLKKYD